jgi:PBP1b-binding outer membrane lipoprotein LpoB
MEGKIILARTVASEKNNYLRRGGRKNQKVVLHSCGKKRNSTKALKMELLQDRTGEVRSALSRAVSRGK